MKEKTIKEKKHRNNDSIDKSSDSEPDIENNVEENENEEEEMEELPDNIFDEEKIDKIMKKLEQIDFEKEIGKKEEVKDTRIVIDKIVLENFKSYAGEKIIYPINYRYNSVVGPNGSGKSNLMESLLFVFGKRAKKMRLKKLSELIHNSSSVNNCKYCRVSVYFREIHEDDEDNFNYIKGGDFKISRIVYRNSSSQYHINDKESSFEEVSLLLAKKGIDLKHNRFLILQGEVEQISMMKPKGDTQYEVGLLEYFEEIIGTKRYAPLIEKLFKNIEELQEIKASKYTLVLASRNKLNSLEDAKDQSLNYYHREKETKILNHLLLIAKKGIENQSIYSKKIDMDKLEDEISQIKKQIEEQIKINKIALSEYLLTKKKIEKLSKANEDIEKQMIKIEEKDGEKKNEMENYGRKLKKAKKEFEKLNYDYSNKNEEIIKANEKIPKFDEELNPRIEVFKKLDLYLIEKEKEIYLKTENLQKIKNEIVNKIRPSENTLYQNNYLIEQNNNTLNLLKNLIKRHEENIKKLNNKKNELNEKLNEIKTKNKIYLDKKYAFTFYRTKKENGLNDMKKALSEKEEEVKEKIGKLTEIKNIINDFNTKHRVVGELIKAQNEGKIKGLYGRLGDLGAIDKKYDIAISSACNQLDHLVVDKVDNAKNIINYLRKNKIGMASIIILEKISWIENNFQENYNCPPGTRRLFDLIKYEDRNLKNAFYFALRDTLVTSDLNTATKVGFGQNRYRVVTLDGIIIESSGAMKGGGRPKRGLMSSNIVMNYYKEYNQQELDKLEKECRISEKEYNEIKNQYNLLEQEYQKTIITIGELEKEGNEIESNFSKINKKINEIDDEIKSESDKINNNSEQLQINKIEKENADIEKENKNLMNITKELRQQLDNINNQINNLKDADYCMKSNQKKELEKEIDQLNSEKVQCESIVNNANKILEILKEEIKNKEEFIRELKNKIKECENAMVQNEEDLLKLVAEKTNNNNQITKLEEQSKNQDNEISKLKKIIEKLKNNKKDKESKIEEVKEEIKKIQKKIEELNKQLEINEKSFDDLMKEFGFLDDFDKDINKINKSFLNKNKDEENKDKKMDIEGEEEEEDNDEDKKDEDYKINEKKEKKENIMMKNEKDEKNEKEFHKYYKIKVLKMEYPFSEINRIIAQKEDIEKEFNQNKSKLENMKINMQPIEEYKKALITLRERETDFFNTKRKYDKAFNIYKNIKQRRLDEFMEGFEQINKHVIEIYRLLTKGGDAELELQDALDPFNEGIILTVRPNKKSWKYIYNLSGGERTLSSLSLIFALHQYKPSPLYIMDEIDAALDYKNVSFIAEFIKKKTKDAQFIIISLRNQMFEVANELIGIYKTFDNTKIVIFNPKSYDIKGRKIVNKNDKNKLGIKNEKEKENKNYSI